MIKKRLNIQLDEDTKLWCEQQAEKLGISVSGMINVAIAQYKDQAMVISQMPTMLQMVQQSMSLQPKEQNKLIACSCHKCGAEVSAGVLNHFTAEDGRILCDKCSKDIKPISDRLKSILIESENRR